MPTVTTLPQLALHLGVTDHGPGDNGRPSASCPHCGSGGRYIHNALTSEGGQVSAMGGCIKLFPTSRTYDLSRKVQERVAEYEKKGWKLTSWDRSMIDSIMAFYGGRIDHAELLETLTTQSDQRSAYYDRKYAGRRY